MRTTLDIDDDILAAAKERARIEKKTAGEVISELARKALTAPSPPVGEDAVGPFVLKDGWYVLPSRGGIITNELVAQLIEEADFEDAGLKKPE